MNPLASPHGGPALLHPQPPLGDEDRVAAVLGAIEQQLGFVPDGLRLYALSPPLLDAFAANIAYFRGGSRLPPVLTTMIRYLVSADAGCQFCIDLNEGLLSQMGVDLDRVRQSRSNHDLAPIEERERPLLSLALLAVDDPDAITGPVLDALRKLGWRDREIFDSVVQATNNRAFNLVLRTFKIDRQGVFA